MKPIFIFSFLLITNSVLVKAQIKSGFTQQFSMSESSMIIPEAGIIVDSTDRGIEVSQVLPLKIELSKELIKGDILFGMNGKRYASISEFKDAFQVIEEGENVKFGIRRNEERFLSTFIKKKSQGKMIVQMNGNTSPKMDLINLSMRLGILGSFNEEGLIVDQVFTALNPDLAEVELKSVLTHINDKRVKNQADLKAKMDKIKTGNTFSLKFKKGDKVTELSTTLKKPTLVKEVY